jgi:putative peptidoglycan lipid II flippase
LLDTVLASFLITGSISWLYYSDRLMEFPLGVLGVALGTVILPNLSARQAESDPDAFNRTLDWGLRMALIFGLPAAMGLAVLAGPMIATLFLSDVFTAHDVGMARLSLMAYASGLLAFILIKVLAPGFYARQDTRTPVRIGVIAMAANMLLNLALIVPLQHAGLALATSLSAYLNAWLLLRSLKKSGAYRPLAGWPALAGRVLSACALMGLGLYWLAPELGAWLTSGTWWRIGWLAWVIAVGGLLYVLFLLLLGLRPAQLLLTKRST